MTNTPQSMSEEDKKLELALMELFAKCTSFGFSFGHSTTKEEFAEMLSSGKSINHQEAAHEAMKLITQYSLTKQLEARVDELENRLRVQFIPSHWERLRNETNSWAKYVDRRIAELKHQLGKVSSQ